MASRKTLPVGRTCVSWRNPESLLPSSRTMSGRNIRHHNPLRRRRAPKTEAFVSRCSSWSETSRRLKTGVSQRVNLLHLMWSGTLNALTRRLFFQIEEALGREGGDSGDASQIRQRRGSTEGDDAPARSATANIAHEVRGTERSRQRGMRISTKTYVVYPVRGSCSNYINLALIWFLYC